MDSSKMSAQDAFLKDFLEHSKEDAETCFRILWNIFSELKLTQAKGFLKENAICFNTFFANNLSMRKLILTFAAKNVGIPPDPKRAPSLICNVAGMLNLIRYYMSSDHEWQSTNYDAIIENTMQELGNGWIESCNSQINCLNLMINRTLEFLKALRLGNARIILVELPIGNSIPVKLFYDILLQKRYNVIQVRIALSRNDSRSIGITREKLIDTKLAEVELASNDILFYFDEWLSGANFYNLSSKLFKIAKEKNAFLYPIAAISPNSSESPRYNTFIASHNRMAKYLGLSGAELRVLFPVLNPDARKSDQTFFWSESDRLAGFRKMQHVGSILGSIFEVVEQIKTDSAFREAVRLNFLKEIAEVKKIEDDLFTNMLTNTVVFEKFFYDSYADFVEWKKEIEHIYHESNLGVAEDSEESLSEICQIISDKTEGRKAKACVILSIMWQKAAEIDPRDQYYFHSHVPVISILPDDQNRFSRLFYSKLKDKITRDLMIE